MGMLSASPPPLPSTATKDLGNAAVLKFQLNKELFSDEFFEDRESKALGVEIRVVKPVLRFPGGNVRLGYNVGTRGNGVDCARWPRDLLTEVIREKE
jgi:hypothetical protein